MSASPAAAQRPDLGVGASLHGKRLFPLNNPWNQEVSALPVDPNSATLIASIGLTTTLHADFGSGADWTGIPFGIPYIVVKKTQPGVPVSFDYTDESDSGPYPIPTNAPIEGGANASGDRHVLVIDRGSWQLYELFAAYPQQDGSWHAGSGAQFKLSSNVLRPLGWTSADAAGLPIFPGLVRYDEVGDLKEITHALRFTVARSRKAFVAPARHAASSLLDPKYPPMGMRVRLKSGFDISSFPPQTRVILTALKKYGMFVADNGSSWFISGAPDSRWDDTDLNTLKRVPGSAFEVVQMGDVLTTSVRPPASVNAAAGKRQVVLTWSASSGASGYTVKRSRTSGGRYATVASGVSGTSYVDTGLAKDVTFYYVVTAVNATGQSFDSSEVFAVPTK